MVDKAGRGFVTIATGSDYYYRLASNLLHSYRMHCSQQTPFSIISDRKNKYTEEFDDVIILNNPSNSYMDKLRLFEYTPYDETIFIDADSLAYGDLDIWWERFASAGDFSVFGFANEDLTWDKGWFLVRGMKEYTDQIQFIPNFNGGVYYIKNTEKCQRVFEIANKCALHYQDYSFCGFKEAADEPVLALGMAVCGFKPISGWVRELLFAPDEKKLEVDIIVPKAIYYYEGDFLESRLIHWNNYKTRKSLYKYEVDKMNMYLQRKTSILYKLMFEYRLCRFLYKFYDVTAFCYRLKRYAARRIKEKTK